MIRIENMSDDEQRRTYYTLDKDMLIEILIESNKRINRLTERFQHTDNHCNCPCSEVNIINNIYICSKCNKPINS